MILKFKKWLDQLRLNKKRRSSILQCRKLYQNISSFTLAQNARSEQQLFSYEYIYGEINFDSFSQLLKRCTINPDSIFYDLGSGSGKAVMCAALLHDFKKVCGIEQLQLLHECALKISEQIPNKNIHLYQADLLNFDCGDADIIFINASAFIGDFWQQVMARLTQLKTGTQIILVSKRLPEEFFRLTYSDFLPMSWGWARVGIYLAK